MIHINEPHLYITYVTRDETGGKKQAIQRKLGPYYTLSIKRINGGNITYEAQTDRRQFVEVTVPLFYHALSATIDPKSGLDIR